MRLPFRSISSYNYYVHVVCCPKSGRHLLREVSDPPGSRRRKGTILYYQDSDYKNLRDKLQNNEHNPFPEDLESHLSDSSKRYRYCLPVAAVSLHLNVCT